VKEQTETIAADRIAQNSVLSGIARCRVRVPDPGVHRSFVREPISKDALHTTHGKKPFQTNQNRLRTDFPQRSSTHLSDRCARRGTTAPAN